jgi:hypothetical protein
MKTIVVIILFTFSMCNSNNRERGFSDEQHQSEGRKINNKDMDTKLIGTWLNTEVLGAGGSDGMSFSTEYFMEFRENGTVLTWTGRSAGSGASMDSDEANADRGEWYTEGKILHLVDPATKQEATTYYSVDDSRLLLSDGSGSQDKTFEKAR